MLALQEEVWEAIEISLCVCFSAGLAVSLCESIFISYRFSSGSFVSLPVIRPSRVCHCVSALPQKWFCCHAHVGITVQRAVCVCAGGIVCVSRICAVCVCNSCVV